MMWFKNKNKKNKEKEKTKKLPESKPEPVLQQESQFDIEPAFFNYAKIKTNAFLSNDEEYERRKLIEDAPNGDVNYLNVDKNKVEINQRRLKDEAAFKEINANINSNYSAIGNDLKNVKATAVHNINNSNPENLYPIKSRQLDNKFYSNIAKGLNKEYDHISEKTAALLKENHTKILNTNNLNEPLINTNENYEMGGSQTTSEWVSTDSGVNSYKNLTRAREGLLTKADEYETSNADMNNLLKKPTREFKTSQMYPYYPTHDDLISRHSSNIDNEYIGERNGKLFTQSLSNVNSHRASINLGLDERTAKTRQINQMADRALNKTNQLSSSPINSDISHSNYANANNVINDINRTINLNRVTSNMKNNDVYITKPISVKQAPNYNELLLDKMESEINEHMIKRQSITSQLDEAARSKNHIYNQEVNVEVIKSSGSELSIESLIPVNEVKMDLRVRKSQKKAYAFNNRGCF